jgi:cytochrome oxidase assembly protein ShyY1
MDDFSQVAAQITQMRNFFVNEAVTTAQQVQAGARQIQNSPAPAPTNTGSNGFFWFGLGTATALVVGYYLWKKGQ